MASSLKVARIAQLVLAFMVLGSATVAQNNARTTRLHGSVADSNQAAIPGATLSFEQGNRRYSSAVTDQQGLFSVALEPGEYTVRAMADGFAEIQQKVRIDPKDDQVLRITLPAVAAAATVTITDNTGYGVVSSISTATKTLTPLRDIPQSISLVTEEQIRDQSLTSVSDAVAYVPGVTAHQGENNRDQLVIRGNSTSADFFLNGVRDDVQYYRDMYNVERVEILKGPNSMLFGRGGGGGVVNRVSKEAEFATSREFQFQTGSFGSKRATADFNQPLNNKLAFRINGLYENSNSFREFVNLQRYGINPSATITPDDATVITVNYEHFRDQRTADRGIPSFQLRPIDVPIWTFFGDPDQSHVHANVNLASTTVTHHTGRFDIRNRTHFGHYDRGYQNFVPGAVTPDKAQVSISAYNNATRRRNLFNQTDVNFSLSLGRMKHNLVTGTEVGQQVTDNFRQTGFFNNSATAILVSLSDSVIRTPVTFRQNTTDADNHLKTNLAAAYVQDQMEVSKKLQLLAGLRFDYFDLQLHNNRSDSDLRRIDRLLSPRLGVVVKPVSMLSVYASYSVAQLPSSGDQFASLTNVTQQLKPEKFANYEAGVKWDVRRNLSLTSALYRQNRTNTRSADPNDPTRIVQTGSQRTSGYELGLNGNVTDRWGITGGYAYQDAFITNATAVARKGARVPQVPQHAFSLWNNYRIHPRLGIGLGVVHRSDMFAAIDNTVVLPGYTRADGALFFSIREKWRLQANVQNLFNQSYFLNADNNNNISPGSPRAARVALIVRF